jgi:FdhD protein
MIGRRGATRRVHVAFHRKEGVARRRDDVAVEEPLEIRVSSVGADGRRASEALAVTMRTPGDDFDLVAGFLHGEGIVSSAESLQEITYCRGDDTRGTQEYNVVEARLAPGVPFDADAVRRNVLTSSSCGVCGKASLESVEARGCRVVDSALSVSADVVALLPGRLREGQGVFQRTGGLHAAGLFTADGSGVVVREDVGRHNAVDKTVGHLLLRRALPASERILVVSGRASFEIVQKAVAAGVPVVVAVGAPSSLAVDLAARFGQTLVGFARQGGFNVYAGAGRVS